jgi:regulator of protease activity HflC (stomatin/prohibitin superfamily)
MSTALAKPPGTFPQSRASVTDRATRSMSGYLAMVIGFAILGAGAYLAYHSVGMSPQGGFLFNLPGLGLSFLLALAGLFMLSGLFVMEPNYSAVLQFFGSYVGTDRSTGLRWVNPLYSVHKVSCRVQTNETAKLKVNDANGNPIEIATAVLWRVEDAAKALFQVENYQQYITIQAETCVRKLASSHPYDHHDDAASTPRDAVEEAGKPVQAGKDGVASLLGGGEEVTRALVEELSARLANAGLHVEEARITHLAYAPEIAPAMLRRQQANAVISAKAKIVTGAVDMCHDAVTQLKAKNIDIDGERLAALVSNLLVVLVSDKDASPVVNTGSIYG